MPQRGGSRPFIKDLVPEVTSPDTMDAQMKFILVSGHGETNTRQLMIVPENTFVMFLGQSAFVRGILSNLDLVSRLISPLGYKGSNARRERAHDMFKTFITGESDSLKFYRGAAIYCPGDLLPDTRVNFKSGLQPVWSKGVYTLPVADIEYPIFIEMKNPVYTIVELLKNDIAEPTYIEAQLKPEKREEFHSFFKLDYTDWLKRYHTLTPIGDFFKDPGAIAHIFDEVFYADRTGNLAAAANIPQTGGFLSEFIANFKSAKPYRFFIFTGCRGPIMPAGVQDLEFGEGLNTAEPINFPPQMGEVSLRKFQRRASLSSKCATETGKPAMNLIAVRNAYFKLLYARDFEKLLKAPENTVMANVVGYLRDHFFSGEHFQFSSSIHLPVFAILLTYAYMDDATAAALPEYGVLLGEIRESFGEFTRLLRREAPFPTKGLTIEQILLRYSGIDELIQPFLSNPAAIDRATKGEKALYRPIYEREVAAFRKEIDDVIRKGREGVESLRGNIGELLENLAAFWKAITPEQMEGFHDALGRLEPMYMGMYRGLHDIIEMDQERVFFKYRFLKQRDKEYRTKDSMDLIEEIDSLPGLLKPLRDLAVTVSGLMAGIKAPAAVSAGGGARRRRTRRLRRRN
jgi:hypothetical protein